MLHIWKNIGVHSSTGVQLLFFFNHYVLKAKGCLFSSWSKSNLLFRNLYLWFWLHLNYLCFDSQDMAPNSEDLYLEYKSCLQDILFNLTWTSSSLSLFKSSAVLILLVWNSDMVFLGVSQNVSEQTFHSQFFFLFSHVLYIHTNTGSNYMLCGRTRMQTYANVGESLTFEAGKATKLHNLPQMWVHSGNKSDRKQLTHVIQARLPKTILSFLLQKLDCPPRPLKPTNSGVWSQPAPLNLLQMPSLNSITCF